MWVFLFNSEKKAQRAGNNNDKRRKLNDPPPPIIVYFCAIAFYTWQLMWPLFLPLKPQLYYVLGSALVKWSWPWGLNWLSKQTYRKEAGTGFCECPIRSFWNQWNHKTYILMGPSSCHTMPRWLNERWVRLHECWRRAEGRLSSALVSLSHFKTFKWQGKSVKSALSEISLNLMEQELLSYKVLFFLIAQTWM